MNSFEFWLNIHWSLFLRFKLTISPHYLDNDLAQNKQQTNVWSNAERIHWRIYVALGGDEFLMLAWALMSLISPATPLFVQKVYPC